MPPRSYSILWQLCLLVSSRLRCQRGLVGPSHLGVTSTSRPKTSGVAEGGQMTHLYNLQVGQLMQSASQRSGAK